MKTLINWCNLNQGFLSFILSSLTIILSIIAMGISLRIGKIPYKRKLKIIPFAYCSADGKIFMEIIITNCGHSEIGIEHIKIMDNLCSLRVRLHEIPTCKETGRCARSIIL